jgi:hypothetical protein
MDHGIHRFLWFCWWWITGDPDQVVEDGGGSLDRDIHGFSRGGLRETTTRLLKAATDRGGHDLFVGLGFAWQDHWGIFFWWSVSMSRRKVLG